MPKRFLVLLMAALFGGWYVFDKFEIDGLNPIQFHQRRTADGEWRVEPIFRNFMTNLPKYMSLALETIL